MPPVPRHRARKRLPKPDRRRALKLLAGSPTGCTEALLFAYGITVEMLVGLIEAGLARATPERVRAGSKAIEIVRVRRRTLRRAWPNRHAYSLDRRLQLCGGHRCLSCQHSIVARRSPL